MILGWMCLGWWGGMGVAPAQEAVLRVEPPTLDFGRVDDTGKISGTCRLISGGDAPLELLRLGVNCNCAALALDVEGQSIPIDTRNRGRVDLVLEPGEEATLTISVDARRWPPGLTKKRVLLFHDGKGRSSTIPFEFDVPPRERTDPLPEGSKTARVSIAPPRFDAGSLWVGEVGQGTFEVANDGVAPLVIQAFRPECQCLSVAVERDGVATDWAALMAREKARTPWVLEPGDRLGVTVFLDTKELLETPSGEPVAKAVRIVSNDPVEPWATMTVDGRLRSPARLEPERVRFEPVVRGTPTSMSVTLDANNEDGFALTRVDVRRPELLAADAFPGDDGTWRVEVRVRADAPLGRFATVVELHLARDDLPPILLPIYGRVDSTVAFRGNARSGPERLDFGAVPSGTKKTVTLAIENHDPSVPYIPRDVQVQSRQAEALTVEVVPLEDGVRYEIQVTVDATGSTRFFSGRLRVLSDHPEMPERVLEFRGWRADS